MTPTTTRQYFNPTTGELEGNYPGGLTAVQYANRKQRKLQTLDDYKQELAHVRAECREAQRKIKHFKASNHALRIERAALKKRLARIVAVVCQN